MLIRVVIAVDIYASRCKDVLALLLYLLFLTTFVFVLVIVVV